MKQLNLVQRSKIQSLLDEGFSHRYIAKHIGVHHSTVSREIARNSEAGSYLAVAAQELCHSRHSNKPKHSPFTHDVQCTVTDLLLQDYSPEQIVGHCKLNEIMMVSHERIYQFVWHDKKQGGSLYTHLRHRGRRRRKRANGKHSRSRIPNRVDITERPEVVEQKSRFGDLEIDTIIGRNRKGAIVTINDRATGFLWARRIPVRSAQWTAEAAIEALLGLKEHIHTITADNGLEFAKHELIASQLDIDFYFAHPYKSCQRGANENLNGLLRQYIPKKTDFSTITDEELQYYCRLLNERPRKRLGYHSPIFMLKKLLKNVGVALVT